MLSTQIPRELFLLICGAGVLQSLYVSIYVITIKPRQSSAPVIFLFVLFSLLTLRLGKSVGWMLVPDFPEILINVGFAAHLGIGPAMYLYIKQFLKRTSIGRLDEVHFLPAMVVLIFSGYLGLENHWYQGLYSLLLLHQIVYFLAALFLIFRKSKFRSLVGKDRLWLLVLTLGVLLFQGLYVSNYLLGLTSYAWAPISISLAVYVIGFSAIQRKGYFEKSVRGQRVRYINLTVAEVEMFRVKLTQVMRNEKPWLDPNCTLSHVAKLLSLQPYLLSHLINTSEKVNFATYINQHRINHAMSLLSDPLQDHLKIAAIAHDCGFNSLSSFNQAFKKSTGLTPSQFRAQSCRSGN